MRKAYQQGRSHLDGDFASDIMVGVLDSVTIEEVSVHCEQHEAGLHVVDAAQRHLCQCHHMLSNHVVCTIAHNKTL